jgi:hypothetical protein
VTRQVAGALLLAAAMPAAAAAQTRPPQRAPLRPSALPRIFLTVGVGALATDPSFDQDVRFTLFAEDGSIRGPVSVPRAPRYDLQVGLRVWRRLGAGLSATYFQGDGTMEAEFRLPSPFLIGAPVEVSGSASALRTVTDVHVSALINIHGSRRWQVTAFAGPSFTYLEQQLGHNRFRYDYVFPFTDATLALRDGTTTGTGLGGHAGASVTRRLGRLGVSGTVRYSLTRAELDAFDTPFTINTGGVQISAGLRFGF